MNDAMVGKDTLDFYSAYYFAMGWNTNPEAKHIDVHKFAAAYRKWAVGRYSAGVVIFLEKEWNRV